MGLARSVLAGLLLTAAGCAEGTDGDAGGKYFCGEGTHVDGDSCVADDAADPGDDADADTDTDTDTDSDSDSDSDSDTDTDSDADSDAIGPGTDSHSIDSLGMDFVSVTAGTFHMGCTTGANPDCEDDEFPMVEVSISQPFLIGTTEVTQEQYEALTGETPSNFSECGLDCPVENVNRHEAMRFANQVSELDGLEPCYTCSGSGDELTCEPIGNPLECASYRLPTEAEWEAAARCGTDLHFAGSDDVDQVGWSSMTSEETTHPVGGLEPNACALYDMSGNVWEWVEDLYADYSDDPQVDPRGPEEGEYGLRRGGGWYCFPSHTRVADRGRIYTINRRNGLGIRLVRTLL